MKNAQSTIRRNDIMLLLGILVVALLLFLVLHIFLQKPGDLVVISVDGQIYKSFPLNENKVYTIETSYGKNVVEIKDGSVSMVDADCHDHYCVQQSAITTTNKFIICLPHALVVEITKNSEEASDNEIDTITK